MSQPSIFSEREQEVVARLLEGKSNKQIALALHITIRTVEFHLGNIYSKLQVPSRSEAIIKLSNRLLWKSTGEPEYHELRQATVEVESQIAENKRKPFGSAWRLSVKTLLYVGTALMAVLVIVFLSLANPRKNQVAEQSTVIPSQTPLFLLAHPAVQLQLRRRPFHPGSKSWPKNGNWPPNTIRPSKQRCKRAR
jgi:DNA-binding CsgD family transcriptional regulator